MSVQEILDGEGMREGKLEGSKPRKSRKKTVKQSPAQEDPREPLMLELGSMFETLKVT